MEDYATRDAYFAAMRRVAGTVAIIATEHEGVRGGLAATAWCSLAADPPMMLACVNSGASAFSLLVASRRFSINALAAGQEEVVAIFSARRGLAGDARFQSEDWSTGHAGLPILKGALAMLECELVEMIPHATDGVMIGRVLSAKSGADREPLLFLDGGFARAQMAALA